MNIHDIRKFSFSVSKINDVIEDVLGLKPISKAEFQQEHDRIEAEWYLAIEPGVAPQDQKYAYEVYSDPMYPYLMLDCFKGWTRATVVNTVTFFENVKDRLNCKVDSILDVFGGLGQSSIVLAKAFPDTQILLHGTDEAQLAVARALIKKFDTPNVRIVNKPEPASVVFAMEAMEHLLDPLEFIEPILSDPKCHFNIDGSSFTIDSIGHFPVYMHRGVAIERHEYKRRYFSELNKLGFYQSFTPKRFVHPRFYNGRPGVFVREGSVQLISRSQDN